MATLEKEGFQAPAGIGDTHCHLMVVCMESWFLADKEALAAFFGRGFNTGALPKKKDIEAIPKEEIYKDLHRASATCQTKAPYGKGEHSFLLLLLIDPLKVADASPWAKRFLTELKQMMEKQ